MPNTRVCGAFVCASALVAPVVASAQVLSYDFSGTVVEQVLSGGALSFSPPSDPGWVGLPVTGTIRVDLSLIPAPYPLVSGTPPNLSWTAVSTSADSPFLRVTVLNPDGSTFVGDSLPGPVDSHQTGLAVVLSGTSEALAINSDRIPTYPRPRQYFAINLGAVGANLISGTDPSTLQVDATAANDTNFGAVDFNPTSSSDGRYCYYYGFRVESFAAAVPEPATVAMMLAGLAAVFAWRRRPGARS